MLLRLTDVTLALSFRRELGNLVHDAKPIIRATITFFTSLGEERVLGIPVDCLLHFLVAAVIFLVATRFTARWKAAVLTLLAIVLKEALDVPAKLKLFREWRAAQITVDSVWDTASGLLGLGLGFLLASALGDLWRARPARTEGRALPPLEKHELSWPLFATVSIVLLALSALIVIGFEVAGAVAGRPLLWLPHLIGASLVLGACIRFGSAPVLLVLIPALPFLNWLHRNVATDKLNVGSTLILTLLCWEIVRRLRTRRPGAFLAGADWAVIVYSAYACCIVAVNAFRLGWTVDRVYWLIPVVTGLAVYSLARNLLTDRRLLGWAVIALTAAFGVTAVIGIIEFQVRPLAPSVVPGAFFGGAPQFSVYLSLLWPLVVALALSWQMRPRTLYWACAAAALIPMVLVRNRSCWVAAGVALTVLVVLFLLRRDWALGLSAAIAMAMSFGVLAWSMRHVMADPKTKFKSPLVVRVTSLFAGDAYERSRGRVVDAADEVFRASPLLGNTGPSAHTLHQAHAINYGVLGTVLALAAVLSVLACGWGAVWRGRSPLVFATTAGASACVLAAVIHGMGWSTLVRSSMQPLLWYILGLVPAAARAARETPGTPAPVPAPERSVPPPARAPRQPLDQRRLILLAIMIGALAAMIGLLWMMFSG